MAKGTRSSQIYRNGILAVLTIANLVLVHALPIYAGIEDTAAELGKDKPEAPPATPPPAADPPAPAPAESSAPAGGSSAPAAESAPPADSSTPAPADSAPPAGGSSTPAESSAPPADSSTPAAEPAPSQTPTQPSGSQPSTSPAKPAKSKQPTVRRIDFVDVQAGVLGPGDPVSDDRYYHVYYFKGKANQAIELRLVGSRDKRLALNPVLFVYGPDGGTPIARRFSGNDDDRSTFLMMRLPKSGTYSVIVTSQEAQDRGRYSLALREDRSSYLLDQSGDLTEQSRKLTKDNSPFEVIEFRGRRDQIVNIRVDSLRGEFLPSIYLVDSKDRVVATSSEANSLYTAQIERARLPEEGTYYIVVNSARPTERGNFRVSVY